MQSPIIPTAPTAPAGWSGGNVFRENRDRRDDDTVSRHRYRSLGLLKRLLTLPLVLLLILVGFAFIVSQRLGSSSQAGPMSRAWPRISQFKTWIQRLLRDAWYGARVGRC